jgi:iron complex outermembrane receptor protein
MGYRELFMYATFVAARVHSTVRTVARTSFILSVVSIAAVTPSPGLAADTLPEITVTAPKAAAERSLTQPDLETARSRIERVPGAANVIDAEAYRDGRATTTADTFAYSPGVFAQSRIPGAEEARLSIRGSGLQRTFHGRGIKLLQDGVPINQADGAFDFQAIEPLAARYIEVFRGANALQYGATTLGGAINYVSPTGQDAAPVLVRGELGSYGHRRVQFAAAGAGESADFYVSLSSFAQGGYQQHSEQSNHRLFSNLGYRISDRLETRFFVTAATSDSELPGSLTKAQLFSDRRQANIVNVRQDQHRDFSFHRFANRTTYAWGDQRIEASAFYAYKSLWHPIFQVLAVDSKDFGVGLRYSNDARIGGRRNLFTLGFSTARTRQRDDRFQNVAGAPGDRTAQSDQTATALDAFAENQHYVTQRTALVLGVQATRATRRYADEFLADGDNGFDVRYNRLSPKLGARYELTPAMQVFANVSRSFEPPSFGELAGGPTITPVSAQAGRTVEIGGRGTAPGAAWDVAFYDARLSNELLAQSSATGTPLGTVNAPRTIHRGAELGGSFQFARHFHLRGAYLWNDFRFDGHPVYGNNDLPGIPRHFLRAEIVYRSADGFHAGPNVEWSPQRYPVDMANSLFAESYAVLGFKIGQQVKKGMSWFIDARNLTDRTHAATTAVIADARGLDPAVFNPGIGRSVFVGVEWRR